MKATLFGYPKNEIMAYGVVLMSFLIMIPLVLLHIFNFVNQYVLAATFLVFCFSAISVYTLMLFKEA